MKRVVCSLALVSAFSLAGLTACGDKVNVVQPGVDSTVTGVTVSPPSANLNVGDKVTFTAVVTGGAGLTNRGVTWSSSTPTVASVDATTGVVTAVAGGTTSIIATSSANSQIKGAAAVTVAAAVQPTVTIGQINQTIPGTGSVPATLSNVFGQLDVTVNVDAGTQKLSEVQLLMNCGGADTIVARQPIATGDKAPIDAEAASAPVTLSFNTAAFSPNGQVAFKNGVCSLKAKAITSSGTIVATSGTPLTLNNLDGVVVTTTNTGATAPDAVGAVWKAGSITVAATPILYSGRTPTNISITLPGANTATQSLTPSTTGTTSATWSGTATSGARVTGLTLFSGVDGNGVAIPVHPTVLLVDSNGQDLNLPQLNPTGQSDVRVDNQAPPTAGVVFNPNLQNTQNGWLGSNYTFTSGSAATNSITLPAATTSDNGGVDKVTIQTQWAASPSSSSSTWATFTSVSSLAETSNSTAYDLRVNVCDALNNCAATAALTTFGVDLTAPSLTQTGGPTDKKIYATSGAIPANFSFAVVDTSKTAGVSGSGTGANGLLVRVQGLKPDSSNATGSRTVCALGRQSSASGASRTCVNPDTAQPNTFPIPTTAKTDGEYSVSVRAVDQAGNTSATIALQYYVDLEAPVVTGGVSIPNPITTGTTFSGLSAADSMDVKAGNGNLVYTALPAFFETGTASPTGAAFDNALTRSASVSVSLGVFYRSLVAATGGVVSGAAGVLPSTLNVRAIDAANNLSTGTAVALPAANIGTAVAISNTGSSGITNFAIDSAAPAVAFTTGIDAGKSATLYVNAKAAGATSGNPLTTVCFYYAAPAGDASGAAAGELVKIGCSSAAATTGDFPNRTFLYSFTWTPPAAFYGTSVVVYAVGNTSGLDAVISDSKTVVVKPLP